jgi:hypothetical protein
MKDRMSAPIKTAVFIACLLIIFQSASLARDVRLADFAVSNNRDDLLIFLKVRGAFKKEMIEAIRNGIPTTFSFFIRLETDGPLWFEKTLARRQVNHTIKYNNLKNEFVVERSWDDNKPITTDSFEQARDLMTEIKSLKITSLSALEKGRRYQVRAKAELDKVTLPFNLHYIFFFTELWDFETRWHTFAFEY